MPSTELEPVTSKAEVIRNLGGMADSHDAILQFLNRVIGDLYFPLESFTSTADQWNGIPIVFATVHPDLKAFDEDRDRELARIGGRIVGFIQHAHIVTVGHPRLMGQLIFTDNGQCSQYIQQGVLSLSTGFWCRTNRRVNPATLDGITKPNHVLVFVEDLKNQPKDQGSIILNKEERKYCGLKGKTEKAGDNVDQVINTGKVISAKNLARFQKIVSKLHEIFGAHQEAVKDMEGVLGEMTAERSDVNGDYHSILPPTGATDMPEAFAAGKVTNDMLSDATNYPPTGGMGDQTSMKQAETSGNPPVVPDKKALPDGKPVVPGGAVEEMDMDNDMNEKLTAMGFKVEDGAAFITQLKQMMEDKKALEERVNCTMKELNEMKAQKQKDDSAAEAKEKEAKKLLEEADAEEETEKKAMKQKVEVLTQKVQDLKFEQLVQKLPKGKAPKTDADLVALRKTFDEDGGQERIMNMILESAKGFKPATKEEGLGHAPAGQPEVSPIEAIKNKKAAGIGRWDPYANDGHGGYVDI